MYDISKKNLHKTWYMNISSKHKSFHKLNAENDLSVR